jgi:hypothetical protein
METTRRPARWSCLVVVLALALVAAAGTVAQAAPPGYHGCSSRYGAAGAFEVAVRNMRCSSAKFMLEGGLDQHLNLRRGGFRCHRERNAENVLWVYFCRSSYRRLFFDTN